MVIVDFQPCYAILIAVYIVINVVECVIGIPPLPTTTTAKSNDDTHSNTLDIHLNMQSGSTSLNLKSVIREEAELLSNGIEEKDPTGPCTVQNNDLSVSSEEVCLKQKRHPGVQYRACKKISKNQKDYPKNCKEIQQNGNNVSGIYDIYPRYSTEPFAVLCDMETKGGGWTHIQKRFDGSQDFVLEWKDYKFGFGDLEGEFWLGLQNIYLLSAFELTELLVEVVDRDNVSAHAQYSSFAIGRESQGYTLDRLSGFSGDAGDALTYHLGQKFSTKDLDFTSLNCGTVYNGGWWYKDCHICNLNGKFSNVDLPEKLKFKGIHWKTFRSHEYCHSKSRMLLRPVN